MSMSKKESKEVKYDVFKSIWKKIQRKRRRSFKITSNEKIKTLRYVIFKSIWKKDLQSRYKQSLNDLIKDANKSILKKRKSTNHINQSAQKKVAINSKITLIQHRFFTFFDEARLESHQQTYKEICVEIKSICDHDMKQNINLKTLIDSEFFNQFDTHDVDHSENIFTAESNIALNEVKMFDSQSENSMKFFEKYVFDYFDDVNTFIMFARFVKINISNFCLALRMWCDKKEVKRRTYVDLLQVLKLFNVSKIDKLFNRLFTLQSWFRRQLSLSTIHSVKIFVQFNKQFTDLTKSIERKMHFLDARVMINMILCFNIQMNFHIDMIDIVDNSHEFWHSNNWDSFILLRLHLIKSVVYEVIKN
jgi:hypothetical protein